MNEDGNLFSFLNDKDENKIIKNISNILDKNKAHSNHSLIKIFLYGNYIMHDLIKTQIRGINWNGILNKSDLSEEGIDRMYKFFQDIIVDRYKQNLQQNDDLDRLKDKHITDIYRFKFKMTKPEKIFLKNNRKLIEEILRKRRNIISDDFYKILTKRAIDYNRKQRSISIIEEIFLYVTVLNQKKLNLN